MEKNAPIVYSTVISEETKFLYREFRRSINDGKGNSVAFLRFANSCEREDKHVLPTALQIIKDTAY